MKLKEAWILRSMVDRDYVLGCHGRVCSGGFLVYPTRKAALNEIKWQRQLIDERWEPEKLEIEK